MLDPIALDKLELFGLEEDPGLCERFIRQEQLRAERDPLAKYLLQTCYWEADREQAFVRYVNSQDFAATLDLLRLFKIQANAPLVEIGGGSGFLSWALAQHGFQSVCLLEPNSNFTTGTGYLQSRPDASQLHIENSLPAWYASQARYQTVLTRNCVHHFKNIAWIAACIRQKIEPGGYWVMIREPYVHSTQELYRFMHSHPYSQRYGAFEFAFPPSHFVQALELAGFQLRAVVPESYANNCLSLYSEDTAHRANAAFTRSVRWMLAKLPRVSVACYRLQTALGRLGAGHRYFARPQVMLFQRQEIGEMPAADIWYPLEGHVNLPPQLSSQPVESAKAA